MTFAETMRQWREIEELTLTDAARSLGVPYRTLQDWQAGRREPRGIARRLILNLIQGRLIDRAFGKFIPETPCAKRKGHDARENT